MNESLKINKLILILIGGILLTSLNSMPLVFAQPIQISLTIAVPSEPQWKECTIAAALKDESGNPLTNMDIEFYQCGTSRIGAAKTNSTGVASIKYTPFEAYLSTPPRSATYKVNAVFRGTTNYAQTSSVDVYIEFIFRDIDIFLDYGSYIVGGILAVAIIGVVGYIVFRRRRK